MSDGDGGLVVVVVIFGVGKGDKVTHCQLQGKVPCHHSMGFCDSGPIVGAVACIVGSCGM